MNTPTWSLRDGIVRQSCYWVIRTMARQLTCGPWGESCPVESALPLHNNASLAFRIQSLSDDVRNCAIPNGQEHGADFFAAVVSLVKCIIVNRSSLRKVKRTMVNSRSSLNIADHSMTRLSLDGRIYLGIQIYQARDGIWHLSGRR